VRRQCFVPQQRIRPKLPQHQIGFFGDDGAVQARKHSRDIFPVVTAPVQHRDFMSWEMAGKFLREAARIRGG
jgi:hypothetical protein